MLPRSRRLLLALAVPVAAITPAVALARGGAVGPADPPAPSPPTDQRVTEVEAWSLVGTADAGRSIVVRDTGYGGCQSAPVASATERAGVVEISVTSTVPAPGAPIACPAIAVTGGNLTVRLSAKVAGRRVTGAKRLPAKPFSTVSPVPAADGRPAPLVVPDVRGLRALDARRALCGAGFASRSAGRSPASAPVRATDPRAGSSASRPSDAVLARRTSAGSCSGPAWKGARRIAVLTAPR